jgi:hypothetical protein
LLSGVIAMVGLKGRDDDDEDDDDDGCNSV